MPRDIILAWTKLYEDDDASVAELGAAFLCAKLTIEKEPRPDHANYITNWLNALKGDKKFIFSAAARAQEAADFLSEWKSEIQPNGILDHIWWKAMAGV